MQYKKRSIAAVMLAVILMLASCGQTASVQDDTTPSIDTTTEPIVETTEPVTSEPETTLPPETTPAPETLPPEPEIVVPEILNPLTGLEAKVDYTARRPAAIMINNIKVATPQEGISYADIMYECIVEGGLTRLMMVVSDYENLPVVGSVRSAREYYLDFAANHNALFIHAGGSDQAYDEIQDRKVNNLDGVNMYIPDMFYRDEWRRKNMGYVHSLVTDGARITAGIKFKKYSTAQKQNFDSPLDFVPYGEVRVPDEGEATYLRVTYSGSHMPYFQYNEEDGLYYRWQFLGDKHMDKAANKQIAFENVIVLYLPTTATGDAKNHMDVSTTGSGKGYYLSAGGYETITWKKANEDAPVKLYNKDGEELLVNRGKTFFQICTTAMEKSTELK